jgi:hypothetical protein
MPNLTPAELADGLAMYERRGTFAERFNRIHWFENHGHAALRELAALREQLAALVAKWRERASDLENRGGISGPDYDEVTEAVAYSDAADELAALDQEQA